MPAATTTGCFTVDEYYRMAEVGILEPGEPVELIDGEIVRMAAIGSRHAACVTRLARIFSRAEGVRGIVWIQSPVRLSDRSEPEPNVALVWPRDDDYATAHPGPDDVFLRIEVAGTTVNVDREVKTPLYAQAGIPEHWPVDITADGVQVYRSASAAGYEDVQRQHRLGVLHPTAFPELDVPVAATVH